MFFHLLDQGYSEQRCGTTRGLARLQFKTCSCGYSMRLLLASDLRICIFDSQVIGKVSHPNPRHVVYSVESSTIGCHHSLALKANCKICRVHSLNIIENFYFSSASSLLTVLFRTVISSWWTDSNCVEMSLFIPGKNTYSKIFFDMNIYSILSFLWVHVCMNMNDVGTSFFSYPLTYKLSMILYKN